MLIFNVIIYKLVKYYNLENFILYIYYSFILPKSSARRPHFGDAFFPYGTYTLIFCNKYGEEGTKRKMVDKKLIRPSNFAHA